MFISRILLKPKEIYTEFNQLKTPTLLILVSYYQNQCYRNIYVNINRRKTVIGWTLKDIKGINPLICTYKKHLEENSKITYQPQRRLNFYMKEVVRNEVLKLLIVIIIYHISNSK